MKRIKVYPRWEAMIDDEDFELLNAYCWRGVRDSKSGEVFARTDYRYSDGEWRTIAMHRMVMQAKPLEEIDHREPSETLNNQKSNLRRATRSQNNANRRVGKNNTSGFKNVTRSRLKGKPWLVRVRKDGVLLDFGTYETIAEAAEVAASAMKEMHGEFARVR